MENKNLDGQLSFDGDLGLNNPENEKQPEIPVVEFQIGKPAEEENLIFEVIEDKKEKSAEASVAAAPIVEEFVIGTPPANNKHNQKTETTPTSLFNSLSFKPIIVCFINIVLKKEESIFFTSNFLFKYAELFI